MILKSFSAALLCLLLLMMLTLASRAALIVARWQGLFSILHDHTWERIELVRKTNGSWSSPWTSRSSSTTCWGSRLGWWSWRILSRNWPAPPLKGHSMRLCLRSPTWFSSHKVQMFEVMFGIFSLRSLVWHGRRLWIIFQRNERSSDGSPGVIARFQTFSHSTSGFLVSALQGFSLSLELTSSWVTWFSRRTLYHMPEVIVCRFRRPSCLTPWMYWKNCSSGQIMSLLPSTNQRKRAVWNLLCLNLGMMAVSKNDLIRRERDLNWMLTRPRPPTALFLYMTKSAGLQTALT